MEHSPAERLKALCPIPLEIVWHENRSCYLAIRREKRLLHMRLHRLFLEAPVPVLEALIRMGFKKDPSARATVRKMAHLYFSQNKAPPVQLPSLGATYDLEPLLQGVRERYFSSASCSVPAIGWTPARRGRFRSITFGSYDIHRHQIRVNRLLDDPAVPLYFLEFIIYHEMLHAVCPSRLDANGRCLVHTPQFRKEERRFAHFEAAKEWEKKSLEILKRRKRTGVGG